LNDILLGVAASVPYISHSRLSHTIGKAHGNEKTAKKAAKPSDQKSSRHPWAHVRAGRVHHDRFERDGQGRPLRAPLRSKAPSSVRSTRTGARTIYAAGTAEDHRRLDSAKPKRKGYQSLYEAGTVVRAKPASVRVKVAPLKKLKDRHPDSRCESIEQDASVTDILPM
jgi:hypothetical protein